MKREGRRFGIALSGKSPGCLYCCLLRAVGWVEVRIISLEMLGEAALKLVPSE
jgi:hypothetical protein